MPAKSKSSPKIPKKRDNDVPPQPLTKLLKGGSNSPLLRLLNSQTRDEIAEVHIAKWYQHSRDAQRRSGVSLTTSSQWIEEIIGALPAANDARPGAGGALTTLAAAQALRELLAISGEADCCPVLERLISQTEQLKLHVADTAIHPWLEQMLAVELPLTLAYQLPALVVQADLAQPAADWMAGAVGVGLDDDGWPRAELVPLFGPLMASWVRSLKMIAALELDFSAEVSVQIEWGVRQLLRLVRSSGSLMMSGPAALPITDECLATMLKISGEADDRLFAKGIRTESGINVEKLGKLASSSSVSEWGESGVLRSQWRCRSPYLAFEYSQRSFSLELGANKSLIVGSAFPQIKFNGQSTTPIEGFEIVCDEHDQDVDYIELQMPMTHSITLTRQLILSRSEEFLLVTDCIVPLLSGQIEYQCDWPLADGLNCLPESETREMYLQDPKIQALVLPLSLPEWKVGRSSGRLECVENRLRLTDSVNGAGLYVPLVFDLNAKRAKKKRTWRHLTVAEDRRPVSREIAAAFRFQLDKQQWYFYRAVSQPGNRSFLGENFNGEFVIGRFDRRGTVTEMLRIQS